MNRFWALLDVRPAEARPVAATFGSLFLIVLAHALLETARDALFLVHLGSGSLGWIYIASAAVTLVGSSASSRLGVRFGVRPTLIAALLASSAGAAAFAFLPTTPAVVVGLYGFSAVSGAVLVPQLWATISALFHAGQGRRLFGTIAAAGVLGGVTGTTIAAALLLRIDVRHLVPVAAVAFAGSGVAISVAPAVRPRTVEPDAQRLGSPWRAARSEPVVPRLAAVVALGAVTTLLADYLFKAVAVTSVPPEDLGSFFARYYLAMNLLALLTQLLIARRLLARAGVIGTASFMPGLMMIGSILGFVTGGASFAVIGTKAVDGALRHSVHRTGLELIYLAIPPAVRDRVRPLIDGALPRMAQAAAAGLLLALAAIGHDSLREIALVAAICGVAWAGATASLRGPYLALFRRALLAPNPHEARSSEELELASGDLLIEALSSPRPREVVAAMNALARRGRTGLIPGLVLLRDEEAVLVQALGLLGPTDRSDWVRLTDRLVVDPREGVRRAALRALARGRRATHTPGSSIAGERPWIRGYLTAASHSNTALTAQTSELLTNDADGREARLGWLTAVADAEPSPALASALARVVEEAPAPLDPEARVLLASAAARVGATALIPRLVQHLSFRAGRSETRAGLAALGPVAEKHVAAALLDESGTRRLRIQLPLTLAEIGTQAGADVLFDYVRRGDDGQVRYRCLQALERAVTDHVVRVVIHDVRALIERDLIEYFRTLALVRGLGPVPLPGPATPPEMTRALIIGVLDDKREQALTRVFRMLKLCFPTEDLRQVHLAISSSDPARRANAAEFLDAILAPRRSGPQDAVRALLRLVIDDAPDGDRLARAASLVSIALPEGVDATVALLRKGRDRPLAALAACLVDELEEAT